MQTGWESPISFHLPRGKHSTTGSWITRPSFSTVRIIILTVFFISSAVYGSSVTGFTVLISEHEFNSKDILDTTIFIFLINPGVAMF